MKNFFEKQFSWNFLPTHVRPIALPQKFFHRSNWKMFSNKQRGVQLNFDNSSWQRQKFFYHFSRFSNFPTFQMKKGKQKNKSQARNQNNKGAKWGKRSKKHFLLATWRWKSWKEKRANESFGIITYSMETYLKALGGGFVCRTRRKCFSFKLRCFYPAKGKLKKRACCCCLNIWEQS